MDWLKQKLDKPEMKYWPELRWWLAEGFHTDETLKKDIAMIHDAGFGAVEFLAMIEHGADHGRYGWGSEEWIHDSRLMIRETTARKMGVSFTSGTNWATANLTCILPDDKSAAKELNFAFETMVGGQSRSGPLNKPPIPKAAVHELLPVAVVAAKRLSKTPVSVILDRESLTVLSDKVIDGRLSWTAPEGGIWELLTFWMHGTGQSFEPAQGTAYTVNYVDPYGAEAVINYWNNVVLSPEIKKLIKENGRAQMYMDSLELATYGQGNQHWGYTLLDEFKKRQGYDLTPYLPYIVKQNTPGNIGLRQFYYDSQDDEFDRKLRNDLCAVQTALYMDNMLKPFRAWLHKQGITLRAEISYNMPYEITMPGKYIDDIEGESLDFASQPEAFRHFAGLAFLLGKGFSSETGAQRHNYMKGINFFNQIIFTQFYAGVSRTVLHGYSSIAGSDASTRWPGHDGMLPRYSERFGIRQPAYRHYGDWTSTLARFQMILREGAPKRDILMLRLDYHFNSRLHRGNGITDEVLYEHTHLRAHEGIYWRDMSLQDSGYTWDYAAPQLLEEKEVTFSGGVINPEGPAYRALVIYQDLLPLSSAALILKWAKKGLPVLIVNNVTEEIRNEIYATYPKAAAKTPYNDGKDGELEIIMAELKKLPSVRTVESQKDLIRNLGELGVRPRTTFDKPNDKILTFTRDSGGLRYVFVYHYMYKEKKPFDFTLNIEGEGRPFFVDCWRNSVEELALYASGGAYTKVPLSLNPGEAVIIALAPGGENKPHAVSTGADGVLFRDGKLKVRADKSGSYTTELSDGRKITSSVEVPEMIKLPVWDLEVESWDEGEKKIIEEDRGLGYVTREVYYETKKTLIKAGKTKLVPWKDIPSLGPEVSGIGFYTASFTLPGGWNETNGAVLKLESVCDNSLAVYVNGKKIPAVDYALLKADITEFLKAGENTVMVEVSTTLNNKIAARGYFEGVDDSSGVMINGKRRTVMYEVKDYGMTGKAGIYFYTLAEL